MFSRPMREVDAGAPFLASCARSGSDGKGAALSIFLFNGVIPKARVLQRAEGSRAEYLNRGWPVLLFCKRAHREAPAWVAVCSWYISYGLSSRPKLLIPEGGEKRSGGTRCFLHGTDQEQRVGVSSLACIRCSAAAMSAKKPRPLAKNASRAGHPLWWLVKAWANPRPEAQNERIDIPKLFDLNSRCLTRSPR